MSDVSILKINSNSYNLKDRTARESITTLNNDVFGNSNIIETGETLTLNNTINSSMKLDLYGNTSQSGTPTPSSPQSINVVTGNNSINICSKNLVYEYHKSNNIVYLNETTRYEDYIFEAGTYTFSYKDSNNCTLSIKDTTGTQTSLGTGKVITFTSNYDFNIFLYRSGITVEELSEVMLEKGSVTTPTYEPYIGQTYPINLGTTELCKIGDYKDSIFYNTTDTNLDLNSWYIKKNISKYTINSSTIIYGINGTNANASTTSANGAYVMLYSDNNLSNIKNDTILYNVGLYEYKSSITNNQNAQNNLSDNTLCIRQGTNDRIYFKNSDFTGFIGSEIKTQLLNKNFYYILSSPTYTKITDTTLLGQLNDFRNKAKSYNNQTNITQINNDKPFIITANAFLNNINGRIEAINNQTKYEISNETLIL